MLTTMYGTTMRHNAMTINTQVWLYKKYSGHQPDEPTGFFVVASNSN